MKWGSRIMNIDAKKVYMMPLIMGPILPEREKQVGSVYKEIQYTGLQYQTDPEVRSTSLLWSAPMGT